MGDDVLIGFERPHEPPTLMRLDEVAVLAGVNSKVRLGTEPVQDHEQVPALAVFATRYSRAHLLTFRLPNTIISPPQKPSHADRPGGAQAVFEVGAHVAEVPADRLNAREAAYLVRGDAGASGAGGRSRPCGLSSETERLLLWHAHADEALP